MIPRYKYKEEAQEEIMGYIAARIEVEAGENNHFDAAIRLRYLRAQAKRVAKLFGYKSWPGIL